MKSATEKVRYRYNRNAPLYDFMERGIERRRFSAWRRDMFAALNGRVLEVGVGTGKNLQYYPAGCDVTGIDISSGMMSRAGTRARDMSLKVDLQLMDAQHLAFENDVFDYVVDTFVLCSVPDPIQALREMKRVLKPDGRLVCMEHVLSANKAIALFEHLHNPIVRFVVGANVNRDTRRNIELAGFEITEDLHLGLYDVLRRFTAKKWP